MNSKRADFIQEILIAQLPVIELPKKDDLPNWINTPNILLALGIVFLVFICMLPDKKSNKLANSSWGGTTAIAAATKKGRYQIKNSTRNSVSLYINPPDFITKQTEAYWKSIGWQNPVEVSKPKTRDGEAKPPADKDIKTFFVPDAQRGILIAGGAGTGKTFFALDPMVRSAVDQGHPVVLYDFKYPEQSARIGAYAKARGYQVEVFAPGYEETCICNLTEFIKDENDAISASQLAKTINANMSSGDNSKKDPFFDNAGEAFIEGALLLTKAVPKILVKLMPQSFDDGTGNPNDYAKSFDDVMTTQAIIALPDVAKRLAIAKEKGIIPAWSGLPFNQAISVKDAEKTVSSIVATASAVFRNFIKKDFVKAFIGKSNIPERIEGKKLLIFGLDNINRDVISPILASVLHMTVRNNIYGKAKRKDPLIVSLDEVASIKLPALNNWLAEGREMGFCGILALQNLAQLERAYGKENTRIIFGNCATKFIFNPQELDSAKMFADILGETQISYYTTSRNRSYARNGGGSRGSSSNLQISKKHLFEPAEFLKLSTGKCVILNPNFVVGEEAYMPVLRKIFIRQSEIAHMDWSQPNWDSLLEYIVSQRPIAHYSDEELENTIAERNKLGEIILPAPPKENKEVTKAQSP